MSSPSFVSILFHRFVLQFSPKPLAIYLVTENTSGIESVHREVAWSRMRSRTPYSMADALKTIFNKTPRALRICVYPARLLVLVSFLCG